jgi:uncharacterized protein
MSELIHGQYIQIRKLDPSHQETWHYWARVENILIDGILLEAFFDGEDRPFYGMKLEKNDRFIERYYADRWYNIYEIYHKENGDLKGWYCNIAEPAVITNEGVSFVDLALDVLVFPYGKLQVLDEDEFEKLDLTPDQKTRSLTAVEELKELFHPPITLRLDSRK